MLPVALVKVFRERRVSQVEERRDLEPLGRGGYNLSLGKSFNQAYLYSSPERVARIHDVTHLMLHARMNIANSNQ